MPARVLAVIGACSALFILAYHLPFNWLGMIGTSTFDIPSYMLPADWTQPTDWVARAR